MITEIQIPSLIVFGRGSLTKIGEVLKKTGSLRPLVVMGDNMIETPIFESLKANLEEADIVCTLFAGVTPDPDMDVVRLGAEAFKAGDHDGLIGFGGGSAMDAAKGINLHLNSKEDIRNWRVPNSPSFPVFPLICIPTTAGTGSEVTRGIVITDSETHEKIVFMGRSCLASAAVIDPDMTQELPIRFAADTGLDALVHALEAYVSKRNNPYSDVMALSALKLIGANIREACSSRALEARSAMMLGAMQAGIAFSNASVALIHGLSRPFGGFFGVPHGMSNAILLSEVSSFSISSASERYAACSRALGFASESDSDKIANKKLIPGLEKLVADLKVPTLAEFGVSKDDYFAKIPVMAEQAIASGSPKNNPKEANAEELEAIYTMVWR